jgi:hypothetical protein
LSARKQSSYFAALTDAEIVRMEYAVQIAYGTSE